MEQRREGGGEWTLAVAMSRHRMEAAAQQAGACV